MDKTGRRNLGGAWRRIPDETRCKIADMMRTHTREEVGVAFGISGQTASKIAHELRVKVRPRGQPWCGVPTVWNAHLQKWPLLPAGRNALNWCQA